MDRTAESNATHSPRNPAALHSDTMHLSLTRPFTAPRYFLAVTTALLLTLTGCARGPQAPDLGGLYNQAAQFYDADRTPVIVIPGILGSKLRDADGTLVWGAFTGELVNPNTADGARRIALPMRPGTPLDQLTDDVRPDGALDTLRISLGVLRLNITAYADILATLGVGGFRDQLLGMRAIDYGDAHFTCFQFDYDWRRSNAENAAKLHDFILEKKAFVESELETRFGVQRDVKFDIVAHSMAGLVTRYYLRHGNQPLGDTGPLPELNWAGAEHVRRAILVGTPNLGSIFALEDLTQGSKLSVILPRYDPALLGTMPGVYQLLPRQADAVLLPPTETNNGSVLPTHFGLDPLDPEVWAQYGWGLLDPDQDRVLQHLLPDAPDRAARLAIAQDHLAKALNNTRRFQQSLDRPAKRPASLDLRLFAGDAVPTATAARIDPAGRVTLINEQPGDATVARYSALADTRQGDPPDAFRPLVRSPIDWAAVYFLFTDHLGLTRDPAFADNVLYLLLDAPPPGRDPVGEGD
ncbi:MAG: hypothetical protein AAF797_08030 [Planctomycetota bacterium]